MYRRPASVSLVLIVIMAALGILWVSNHSENSQESTTTDDRPDMAPAAGPPTTSLEGPLRNTTASLPGTERREFNPEVTPSPDPAPGAFAQSDEELVEMVRASAKEGYLEQPPTRPESFQNSGLSPSDKDLIMQQVVSDSADCFADTVVEYSSVYGVPVSDFVSSDGSIRPSGYSANEFARLLNDCIVLAWQAAGIDIAGDLE